MYVEVVFVTLFKNRPFEAGWAGIGFWYLLEMANIDAETARTATEERAKKFFSLFYLIKEAQKFYSLFYPDQWSFTHFTQIFFLTISSWSWKFYSP